VGLNLLELERRSPNAYKKVGSYINGIIDGIKIAEEQNGYRHVCQNKETDDDDNSGENLKHVS
jgi:hypothetical protein